MNVEYWELASLSNCANFNRSERYGQRCYQPVYFRKAEGLDIKKLLLLYGCKTWSLIVKKEY